MPEDGDDEPEPELLEEVEDELLELGELDEEPLELLPEPDEELLGG